MKDAERRADLQRQPDRGARPKSRMLRPSPPLPLPAQSKPSPQPKQGPKPHGFWSGGERTVILVTLEAEFPEVSMTGTIFLGGTTRRNQAVQARCNNFDGQVWGPGSQGGPGCPGAWGRGFSFLSGNARRKSAVNFDGCPGSQGLGAQGLGPGFQGGGVSRSCPGPPKVEGACRESGHGIPGLPPPPPPSTPRVSRL